MARKSLNVLLTIALMLLASIATIAVLAISQDAFNPMGAIFESAHGAKDKPHGEEANFPEIDWGHWMHVNPDIIGWVTIEGTKVDHPIVQAKADSPAFYLNHAIDGSSNAEGSVFLDAECEGSGLLSKNSVLFGHHLTKERGFAAFASYSDGDFARGHDTILLQTPDWQKVLKVAFVEVTPGNAKTKVCAFEYDEQYARWIKERYDASCVQLQGIVGVLDTSRIWTFCTCSYTTYDDERTLVYAVEMNS